MYTASTSGTGNIQANGNVVSFPQKIFKIVPQQILRLQFLQISLLGILVATAILVTVTVRQLLITQEQTRAELQTLRTILEYETPTHVTQRFLQTVDNICGQ